LTGDLIGLVVGGVGVGVGVGADLDKSSGVVGPCQLVQSELKEGLNFFLNFRTLFLFFLSFFFWMVPSLLSALQ
jgi:hypothetical protein